MNSDSKLPKRNKVSVSILVCFNIVFALCGAAILFLGFLIFKDVGRQLLLRIISPDTTIVTQISCALLAIGGFCIFSALLGCCSAARKCHIGWYIFCVILILLAEIGLGVTFLFINEYLGKDLETTSMLTNLHSKYGVDQSFTQSMDYAQYQFKCCGITGEADYDRTTWKNSKLGGEDMIIPWTCCPLDEENSDSPSYMNPVPVNGPACQNLTLPTIKIPKIIYFYNKGCFSYLDSWLRQQILTFIGMGLAILLLQFATLAAAICLCKRV